MRIAAWEDLQTSRGLGAPFAAAIGVFDGVHKGHMRLIREVLGRKDMTRGVVTFRDNPKKILRPNSFHGNIFTLEQKLAAFADLGLDICVLIDFSGDFSKLAGKDFLTLLRDRVDLGFLAVGEGFRCGHRLDMDAEGIRGFFREAEVETRIIEPLCVGGRPVSSSRIRNAIREGRLDEANSMLGRAYEIDLRGARVLRLPTAVMVRPPSGQVEPPAGLYRGECSGESWRELVSARFAAGEWAIPADGGAARQPEALRLMELVSRE